jgi:hypothetical protein
VPRPKLISRLEENLKNRVTLISAPAGYGKTTLAAQWLDQSRRLSAWLSVDKNDSEPERFLFTGRETPKAPIGTPGGPCASYQRNTALRMPWRFRMPPSPMPFADDRTKPCTCWLKR